MPIYFYYLFIISEVCYFLNETQIGLSSAAVFQRSMCDTATFIKHEVSEEAEHDLCFCEIPTVFLLLYYFQFILTFELLGVKFYIAAS